MSDGNNKVFTQTQELGPYRVVNTQTNVRDSGQNGSYYETVVTRIADDHEMMKLSGHDIVTMFGEHEGGHRRAKLVEEIGPKGGPLFVVEAMNIKSGDTERFSVKLSGKPM